MSDGERLQDVKARLADLPTDELVSIYGRHDEAEWTEEAFAAIRAILAERGVEPPASAAPPETPVAPAPTLGQRIGGAWARHARLDDEDRERLSAEEQLTLRRGLLSIRVGALLAIVIWWVTLAATRPVAVQRGFILVPLVVYTLPYLWILIGLDRRAVRHAVAVAGTIAWVMLAFLSLNVLIMGSGFLAARRMPRSVPMLMVAGNVAAVLPHLLLFMGAVLASKALGPARLSLREWLFTLGLLVLYTLAAALVLTAWVRWMVRLNGLPL